MGFLAPIAAGIGAAIGSATSAVGSGLAAVGGAATAGAATGTAATLAGAATVAGAAANVKSLLSGAPKPPTLTAPPAAIPLASQNAPAAGVAKNKSLAALSPGLALGGTVGTLGGSPTGGSKTLLGN